jgi:hypothetical protein
LHCGVLAIVPRLTSSPSLRPRSKERLIRTSVHGQLRSLSGLRGGLSSGLE